MPNTSEAATGRFYFPSPVGQDAAAVSRSFDPAVDGQFALDFTAARAAGNQAAERCIEKATRQLPEFKEIAERAILAHLRVVGSASGETLTEIAIAHGAKPHDSRAFGPVFLSLSRRKAIVCLRSDLPRKNGHGTSGGRLWGIAA